MNKTELIKELTTLLGKENISLNEPMSKHTTFKVGGPAEIFVAPRTAGILSSILKIVNEGKVPYFILGNGSNLVVSDKGIKGVVICTTKAKTIVLKGNSITASCGVELSQLSKFAAKHGLSGLEFACGIPGTVGGAVYMNAGAYEGEISQILSYSRVFKLETNLIQMMNKAGHEFSYRHSSFQNEQYIHLNSTFKLKPMDKKLILAKMAELTESREAKQPLELPSAGSVFRRPQGYFTGKLIEECNLKGFRIGDAAISTKHCGFIVNLGSATAHDIKTLIAHVQKTIFDHCGVMLQTEIKFVGQA